VDVFVEQTGGGSLGAAPQAAAKASEGSVKIGGDAREAAVAKANERKASRERAEPVLARAQAVIESGARWVDERDQAHGVSLAQRKPLQ